jgi:peptidoglycan hydrolase CwlO-like protein
MNNKKTYSINLLEKAMAQTNSEIKYWENNITSTDPLIVRQARTNYESSKNRLLDLEKSIQILTS